MNKAVRAEHANDQDWSAWSTACQVLTDSIASFLTRKYRRGPFPLCHRDFHYGNILLDNEFNITGVLDWSGAQTVPVEQFAVCPEFITLPGLSEEGNRPIMDFRAMFVKAWKEMETTLLPMKPTLTISDAMDSTILDLVYRCNAGVPRNSRTAVMNAKLVLRLLYGEDITLENYASVRKMKQKVAKASRSIVLTLC